MMDAYSQRYNERRKYVDVMSGQILECEKSGGITETARIALRNELNRLLEDCVGDCDAITASKIQPLIMRLASLPAMGKVAPDAPTLPTSGQLLALVDSLRSGTLNDTQQATVQALRAGILALAP